MHKKAAHPWDWTVGTHGIILNFKDPKSGRKYTGTYLPSVPIEHNMTQDTALRELCKKAGYEGLIDNDFLQARVTLTRYQATVVSLDAKSYREMRPGVW